jgi:hypothetical protein
MLGAAAHPAAVIDDMKDTPLRCQLLHMPAPPRHDPLDLTVVGGFSARARRPCSTSSCAMPASAGSS